MEFQTERLFIKEITREDAQFIYTLMNSPKWVQNIGDRNIRTIEDAKDYISHKMRPAYETGLGFFKLVLKSNGIPIGLCGLVKRDSLLDPDIGFALLPGFEGMGYGFESAARFMKYAVEGMSLSTVLGITDPLNKASQQLLIKLGFVLSEEILYEGLKTSLFTFQKKRPIVKVCGMREVDNIQAVSELDIDWIGMIFYEKSSRNVEKNGTVATHFKDIPQKKVGVFVNATKAFINEKIETYQLNMIQLHGSESPEDCNYFKENSSVKVIKVFSIKEEGDFEKIRDYEKVVDYFLFDTKGPQKGGNGYVFNWELLKTVNIRKPYLLSGGIEKEHSQILHNLMLRNCIGFDINSKFEIEPALKDVNLLKEFIDKLN